MHRLYLLFLPLLVYCLMNTQNGMQAKNDTNVRDKVISNSKVWPHYFADQHEKPWIPIAINYLPEGRKEHIEAYFKKFSQNGGNAMRIWISTSYLEIENEKEGSYNADRFSRIDFIINLAKKYNLKIKFTLQHIRTISAAPEEYNEWSNSTSLASRFSNISEYINTVAGRNAYMNRVRALSKKYKDCCEIYGWELWNEMDAAATEKDWYSFTGIMLDSVKKIMPHHTVTQTLGSMHNAYAENMYERLSGIASNDFLSIHRYLDEGNKWHQYENTRWPMDKLAHDAVAKGLNLVKAYPCPVVINEIGAVDADHSGPSGLYSKDKEGILLHDMLFAPFFSGAAGSGTPWHWDHYVFKNDLWYHFKRFSNAIEGLDPIKEKLVPLFFETQGVRCYALKGISKTLIWCRDTASSWQTALRDNLRVPMKKGFMIDGKKYLSVKYKHVKFYDPWKDVWQSQVVPNNIYVPPFKHSMVVILEK